MPIMIAVLHTSAHQNAHALGADSSAAPFALPLLLQLLASAEDESTRHAEEAAALRRAVDSQSSLRIAAEARAAEEHRQRVDLQHRVEELQDAAEEHAATAAAQEAELVQLRGDLERTRAEGLALAEDKARLEVRLPCWDCCGWYPLISPCCHSFLWPACMHCRGPAACCLFTCERSSLHTNGGMVLLWG